MPNTTFVLLTKATTRPWCLLSIPLNILSIIKVAVQAYIIDCNNLANIVMSGEKFPYETDL